MERNNTKSECKYIGFINNRPNYKCKRCNDKSCISINRLTEKFPSIYQFCNKDLNKFALLLRKGVYPYEYMDSCEKLDKESLLDKQSYYSNLNLENITDENDVHVQRVCEVFKIKNRGEYHDLYVQSDTLLLADVFKKFRMNV